MHGGDKHLRRILFLHPHMEDLGPKGRTHFHRAKATNEILHSSRIDLILAAGGAGTLIDRETARSLEVPYTTTHRSVSRGGIRPKKVKIKN